MLPGTPCELITWEGFYKLSRMLAFLIRQSGFRPDLIVAIGRGGYMPARILSDYLGLMDLASMRILHYRGAHKEPQAKILGKPSQAFFLSAIDEFECPPGEVVMVGDDAVADIEGAMRVGLQGILVKTGKYKAGDENRITLPGAMLMEDICEVVDQILSVSKPP